MSVSAWPRRIDAEVGALAGHYEEYRAVAGFKPGHMLEVTSANKVQKNSKYGARCELLFALEMDLLGKTIQDAYEADDLARVLIVRPGSRVNARIPAGAPAIAIGDKLISNGDGTLIKASYEGNVLSNTVAPSTAVSNTVSTEQFYDVTSTIAANQLRAGDVLEVEGFAVVTAQASTDTVILKVYLGAVAIVTTAAVDAAVGDILAFRALVYIRTAGASGTLVAQFTQLNGVPATGTAKGGFVASTAIDTTVANIVRASSTWSATTATNTTRLEALKVSLVRTGGGGNFPLFVAWQAVNNSAGSDETFIIARALNS